MHESGLHAGSRLGSRVSLDRSSRCLAHRQATWVFWICTPDQIVMEQHSLTHFPSQPWCKMCVESRGHDSPHREQSKIDAVVPQLQFDCGYMGDGGPLQITCFLVEADTSSGAIHATMVPDSKKMDIPVVVAATAKWVRDLGYERFCLFGEKKEFYNCYLTKWQKNVS